MSGKTALIILGSGLYDLYRARLSKQLKIRTRFGQAYCAELSRTDVSRTLVLLRHGKGHSLPPHLINYKANIQAASELGVDFIIATASVGAINPKFSIGDYVVLDQFLDFTKSRDVTFFSDEGKFRHVDMTEPYSPRVRTSIISAIRKNNAKHHARGTYVCTEGPRFETPAEINMFRKNGGDVVGMTGIPEVVLANEIGIPYGTLAQVTNMAAGLQKKISADEVNEIMKKSLGTTGAILDSAVEELTT